MDLSPLIHFYGEHKKIILIVAANVVGVILLVVLVSLIHRAAAGPAPAPEVAPAQEVLTYLADPKFQRQSDSFKLQYIPRVLNHYAASPERLEQLSQEVDRLSDYEALQLRDNIADAAVLQMVEDSKVYDTLRDSRQQRAFLDQKIGSMRSLQATLTGRPSGGGPAGTFQPVGGGGRRGSGSGGGRNLAAKPSLARDVPTDTPGMYKMFIDKTKPGDRARLENYVGDLQKRIQHQKNLERAQSGR